MKPATLRRTGKAFTLIELLVVMVIIIVLFGVLNPIFHRRHPSGYSVACMSKLKQVGLGYLMYASDHANQYPWQVSTNSTMTRQAMESRPASEHFHSLSNYILPLHTFICPTDKARTTATNYASFGNSNLSYFAALSAEAFRGSNVWQLILAGDRHLSVNAQPVKPGLHVLTEKSAATWTAELHKADNKTTRGCLLFGDGHAQFVAQKDLPGIFKNQLATTRLVVP